MIPQVPHKIVGRRAGDVASCYSDPGLAKTELGWVAERGSIFLAIIAIFSCITDLASHCYFLFSHHLLFHVLRFLNEIEFILNLDYSFSICIVSMFELSE